MADDAKGLAEQAIDRLMQRGATLCITPQNLVEFRSVATSPVAVNGLGLSSSEAGLKAAQFETLFRLLEENPAIYPLWRNLVEAAGVLGKQVHDARLVAAAQTHGVTHLLTFNAPHFARLVRSVPGLTVIEPAHI